eukprot:Skav209540  [mRNA]  locus=scaffold2497:131298:132975:+ [translate_table: standard]
MNWKGRCRESLEAEEKHGHAVNRQGACSQICCGESPRKAWPRSEQTGSLLPDMLRGKSPCLGAESATGRPVDLETGVISEAHAELWFWCFGPLQQQSHAMSVCKNANRTGLTLFMPSSCSC